MALSNIKQEEVMTEKHSRLLWEKRRAGMDCSDCGETMPGIHSYAIRDTCQDCGGRSKVPHAYDYPAKEKSGT